MKIDFEEQRRRLVRKLKEQGIIRSKSVELSFLNVPREEFVWPDTKNQAYLDMPLPLGNTGQTISAPHMIAIMLEELDLRKGEIVLEIGTGSGYNAALMAYIITDGKREKNGKVITIERIKELVTFAENNIKRTSYSEYIKVICGDGSVGYPPYEEREIYDKVIITAAAPNFPKILIKQLKVGGIILAPLGDLFSQILTKGIKRPDGTLKIKRDIECIFVPLIGENGYNF
ncbi:MAG: protein-L-isoaspartate(D-aspartate) O-methyltransferase [Nitrososphaeria archaeon]